MDSSDDDDLDDVIDDNIDSNLVSLCMLFLFQQLEHLETNVMDRLAHIIEAS